MSILVSGGCGFIGLNLVEALLRQGDRVVVLDKLEMPPEAKRILRAQGGDLVLEIGDVSDQDFLCNVFRRYSIRQVVHAAVITADAAREFRDPYTIVRVNIMGTVALLAAAHAAGCDRFINIGSGAAYGSTHDEGASLFEESSPSKPTDIYGISKLAAEQIGIRLSELWDFEIHNVRLGSVFGPWEYDTGVRDLLSPYLQTAKFAVSGARALVQSKEVSRDWVYSRDVANGLVALLSARRLDHRVYHLSSGMNWNDTFTRWCDCLSGAFPRFSWRFAEPGEQANVNFLVEKNRARMDVRRLAQDAAFEAQFGPREAFADYVGWIKAHEEYFGFKT